MKPNPGHIPADAIGKRVRVRLRDGHMAGGSAGWPADGRVACRWSLHGLAQDIIEYEVIQ